MRVAGIGTDIIDCLRIARMIEMHGEKFLRRVYTQREIEYCSSRKLAKQHYAARWAGKKAVMIAIASVDGTALPESETWTDIEIRPLKGGQTPVALGGMARQVCLAQGIDNVIASIAHCRHYATGYAMAFTGADSDNGPTSQSSDWPSAEWEDGDWDDDDIPF